MRTLTDEQIRIVEEEKRKYKKERAGHRKINHIRGIAFCDGYLKALKWILEN